MHSATLSPAFSGSSDTSPLRGEMYSEQRVVPPGEVRCNTCLRYGHPARAPHALAAVLYTFHEELQALVVAEPTPLSSV